MAELTRPRRVLIEDERADGKFLRATWHPEGRVFVVSTWDGNVCVGATQVGPAGAADLIRLLADGMADAADPPAAPGPRVDSRRPSWLRRVRAWWADRNTPPLPRIPWATGTRRDAERRSA